MTEPVTCASLLERISAYLDGDLDAADCATIERHAATCAHCSAIIEDFRKATGLCRTAAETPLPDPVRALARARVQELLKRK